MTVTGADALLPIAVDGRIVCAEHAADNKNAHAAKARENSLGGVMRAFYIESIKAV
jgi:hypothetical protein